MNNDTLFLMLMLFALTGIVIVIVMPDGQSRQERAAEKQLCAEMAGEVLAGTASRFDYMGTRCPARLIIAPGES